MKNVLIIDSDLGFVFWLGQALDAAGYGALPAKGISDAVELLATLVVTIDVLMIRSALHGAEAFASQLRRAQAGHLKVIAIVDECDEQTHSLSHWDGWQLKPQLPDENDRRTFLKLVQGVLEAGTAVPSP